LASRPHPPLRRHTGRSTICKEGAGRFAILVTFRPFLGKFIRCPFLFRPPPGHQQAALRAAFRCRVPTFCVFLRTGVERKFYSSSLTLVVTGEDTHVPKVRIPSFLIYNIFLQSRVVFLTSPLRRSVPSEISPYDTPASSSEHTGKALRLFPSNWSNSPTLFLPFPFRSVPVQTLAFSFFFCTGSAATH